jgi:tetratricopeptide (TPR) repeat protein
LINQQAKKKGITITNYQAQKLYYFLGGMPIALIYAVGQRAMGYSLKRILGLTDISFQQYPKDLARFLFERSIAPFKGNSVHNLLLSLVIFQDAPRIDSIAAVAGLPSDLIATEESLLKLQTLSLVQKKDERYYTLATTREYIIVELAKHPKFYEEVRKRWIEWYLKFTQKYGGKDWQNWRKQYDYLDQERENIFSVLYWCSSQDLYQEAQTLWQNIDNYVDLDGHWQIRRYWWKWLIQESDRRADLPTYVQALSERGWTLTLMGGENNLSEADSEFAKALKLHEYADLEIQSRLFCHIAVHRITQKKYDEALGWIKKAEKYPNEANLDERELTREHVYINYHKAQITYWKWNKYKSKKLFQDVLLQAQEIGWERFVYYAQSWLGKILIDEGDFEEAKEVLEAGLNIAQKNSDIRRIAYFQKNLSIVHDKYGNSEKAKELAKNALNIFERENIGGDTTQMRKLLKR